MARQQFRHLAELGAVNITAVGAVIIPAITRLGVDHVERRTERSERPSIGA